MQSNEKIVSQIKEILRPLIPGHIEIKTDADLTADLGLDSLKVMSIIESLEDHLDLSIPINILSEVRTINDLALQIQKLNHKEGN
jgi:acyl carrier protein